MKTFKIILTILLLTIIFLLEVCLSAWLGGNTLDNILIGFIDAFLFPSIWYKINK